MRGHLDYTESRTMNAMRTRRPKSRAGGVLVTTVVMTTVAAVGVGSAVYMLSNHRRMAQRSHARDRAFYLAEAGLAAAMAKLNAYGDANIPFGQSASYFHSVGSFEIPGWGFETVLSTTTNGEDIITSTGRFGGQRAVVSTGVALVGGERRVHALYAHALYAGNSSGDTNYCMLIGGTGSGADFVQGDTYSGNDIDVSGSAYLRLPELLDDIDGDGVQAGDETWGEAFITATNETGLSQEDYDDYLASMSPYHDLLYKNGTYDYGEAYVDTIGDGIYQEGEPFTDLDGDGVRHPGDDYTDENGNGMWDEGEPFDDHGNGVWDDGEEWIEDAEHRKKNRPNGKKVRVNGRYDPPGGYWQYSRRRGWRWKSPSWADDWPAEEFEDQGDGVYYAGEPWVDGNGVYDEGEEFYDDRNNMYDYGTQATGDIAGMPAPGPGQQVADGGDAAVDPPDLVHMYYDVDKTDTPPFDALARWGHDYRVDSSVYGGEEAINDQTQAAHIFVRNPPHSGYVWSDGVKVRGRTYTEIQDDFGQRVNDYFFEDPTDPTYDSYVMGDAIDGTKYTAPMYIDVQPEHNVKVYYVDGNVYLHNVRTYSMRFRTPGTRITVIAKGNITISDEFYYNADYPEGLQRSEFNSTVVNNPMDAFCLIALKNPDCSDSGNIYIGDAQFGTGGAIHAMLYAENNFVDNNLNTANQPFISVFGNMTAGNHVEIMRSGGNRTRLDITLDERIRNGYIVAPGLPHPVGHQRSIVLDTGWSWKPGTWSCATRF